MKTIFFTICSKNFIAQALTLYQSLCETHGAVHFELVLCDAQAGWDTLSLPFPVIHFEALGMPAWDSMKEQYNITELNTALKPFAFQYLFDQHPGAGVVYLDPDILVTSRLAEVLDALAGGAACLLTPHLCEPAEFAEFDDQKFLQFGVYNLGFCALRDTPQVRRVVSWWGRRLETDCVINLAQGLFVDQKWADLFPAYIDQAVVLRHPGYNVAYWNFSQRRVWSEDGQWRVNDHPLRFVHFSGLAIGSPTVFTRHAQTFTRRNIGEVALLTREYEGRLEANGRGFFSTLPYAFSWEGATGRNLHTPQSVHQQPKDGPACWIPLRRETSFAEHAGMARHRVEQEAARRAAEMALLGDSGTETGFGVPGFCALCSRATEFATRSLHAFGRTPAGARPPDWREHLACSHCRMPNRVRAALHVFLQELRPRRDAAVYLTEQVTPAFDWLTRRLDHLQGSEYLGPGKKPGEVIDGIRHEDLQALSFPSHSFDFVLSLDVLDHVPSQPRAFGEIFRVLKPGGRLLFSAPFAADSPKNVVRAPPGEDAGIRQFGWEVLEQLEAAGFRNAAALQYWSRELGYLGASQVLFVAERVR